jgi:hypothetical protein
MGAKPDVSEKPRGPKPRKFNQEQRDLVKLLAGGGMSRHVIAPLLRITERTLERYFPHELIALNRCVIGEAGLGRGRVNQGGDHR